MISERPQARPLAAGLVSTGPCRPGRVIVRVEHLSKRYRIRSGQGEYKTLRDTLADGVTRPLRRVASLVRRPTRSANQTDESVWALHDVSFEVRRGETIGIIGRNGAGKSTLLKVLSRITEPTAGHADVHGQVGALLEVGTGFHPELTGRENIYLNAAILGMKRRDIRHRLDAIVAFAEVSKFLDTPVKHYSSGMQLRLAFAVAAHLDPEILVVDEVLAVGDSAFQRRCLDKMHQVTEGGRTVLFVSHNMPAVTRLCPRTILLDAGGVVDDGPSYKVAAAYLNSGLGTRAAREWNDIAQAPGSDVVRLCAVRVRTADGRITEAIDIRQPIRVEIEYDVLKPGYPLWPHYTVNNEEGVRVFVTIDGDPAWRGRARPPGHYVSTGWIPGNFLSEGTVIVCAGIRTEEPLILHAWERDAVAFQVIDSIEGDSARGDYLGPMPGIIRPRLKWTTTFRPNDPAAGVATVGGARP
jgi:lipopolysaccharide transport system ATP-binding protein